MLVVTWERVSPYARFFFFNPYTDERSSYQAVLVTNGTSSYIIYSYEDGGMNWNRRLRRKCAVGYATKDKKYSFEDEDSFSENIFQIDSKEFDVDGIKTRGTFCKSLNAPDKPIELTNEQKCMNWYNEEPDPKDWLEELTDCPATIRSARRDNRYRRRSSSGARVHCYELRFPTTEFGASHQCCYFARRGRRGGAFVSEPPQAGRAYRYHFRNQAMRQKGDIEPFEACCGEGESLCNLFYEKRPLTTAASSTEFPLPCSCRRLAGGCRRRPCRPRRRRRPWILIIFVRFWGDPHLLTLDGFQYTFNGLGDYVLVRTLDGSVHLHARTKRPVTTEGGLSNATVISALAFKTKDSDKGQIAFDDSVPGNLSFTITGMDGSCKNFTIADFGEGKDFTGMSIERSTINNNTAIISFPSGLSIEVSPGLELLQLGVKAPGDMMNKTEGLLGNFNGDKTDELMYPNGTKISSNSTEQEIFHLGQQWVVPHDERLFVSSNCTLQNVSFDDMFVPAFLNLSAVTDEIKEICGDNRECYFDVMQTGNKELAQETKGFEEETEAAIAELENTPPNITGPAEINVTVNQMTKFYLTVSDADNDDVTLEVEEIPEGASFTFNASENVGHFFWTPVNASNITLEFVATDSKNDTSVHPVVINMCRCENNGTCDFTESVGDDTGPFRIVGCNCSDEFEGNFCEMEVLDACADDPCADNVTCNTTRNPFGFKCGPCPPGLTGNGEDCFEYDECANESLSQCNQTCVNTFGSFRCECKQGYTSRDEGRICEDINECQDAGNLNNCSENAFCTNLPGSHNCTCNPGYEGDPMKNCTDINECDNGVARCSHTCHNEPGSFKCSCQAGFKLAANNQTCYDINECEGSHNCERMCENRIGSYICKCPPGFELNSDNVTCKVAQASACDATKGNCSDICVNRTGEITCFCKTGYNLTADRKTCEDINECMMGNHGCSEKCLNTNGSFACGCHPGYALTERYRNLAET
ncbi:mucin-like protein [Stylophora pistillata]|uniref:mucin-like protein n=1 Tax=Stylophora pistillata TaxID=50429 RepID=UPI000C053A66|nr:mucin-like protein [Stylophora pistillata]